MRANLFPGSLYHRLGHTEFLLYFYQNWAALAAHFNGLRQLVTFRGGADNLGWQA